MESEGCHSVTIETALYDRTLLEPNLHVHMEHRKSTKISLYVYKPPSENKPIPFFNLLYTPNISLLPPFPKISPWAYISKTQICGSLVPRSPGNEVVFMVEIKTQAS